MSGSTYPLKGIKVVEFSHMVLGPRGGLILADLGADVVKVEPALPKETKPATYLDQDLVSLGHSIATKEVSLLI